MSAAALDALRALASAAEAWGAPLDATALARLESYLKRVQEANARVNLTADGSWEDLVLKHAADGVYAAAVLRAILGARVARARVLDLGSGAGFIGVCLKIAWPEAEVTLMEALERKFRFLSSAAADLGLVGLRVLRRRAGDGTPSSSYETAFDAVVERALAPLPDALRLGAPLLAPDGVFAAFQSEAPDASEPALARALAATGMRLLEARDYRRPREERARRLALFSRDG